MKAIREQCAPWLDLETDAGLCRLLDRLGISHKRGRHYTYSPDPDYQEKRDYIQDILDQVREDPEQHVLLYQDECGYYRKPSLSKDYEAKGKSIQPRAHLAHAPDKKHRITEHRITGCLNAVDGRVHFRQAESISTDELIQFYRQVATAYPEAETIYVVQDNWPVHFHADLIGQLEKQEWPWSFGGSVPDHWPEIPEEPTVCDPLPIQLLCLPTYASWLNPIEKLWRWLRQEVLHLHRLAEAWGRLKERVASFLERFAQGSTELLRCTGLLPT